MKKNFVLVAGLTLVLGGAVDLCMIIKQKCRHKYEQGFKDGVIVAETMHEVKEYLRYLKEEDSKKKK